MSRYSEEEIKQHVVRAVPCESHKVPLEAHCVSEEHLARENPMGFQKTKIQYDAIQVLGTKATDIMLYGGSRSGKTFIIVYAIIVRACKYKSRHVSFRLRFNHAKTSLWFETIPKVLSLCFPDLKVTPNKTDYFISFPNGSEYWVAGLDDKERTEKILGKEFSTLHFNECSQIPLSSVLMAKTRLAERNLLKKKAYYDENPPRKTHWSYWYFIKKVDPETSEPLAKPHLYDAMQMNPVHNLENIDPAYIENVLSMLPQNEQSRFLKGEFQDEAGGEVYYAFKRELHTKSLTWDMRHETFVGMDFNVSPMTAVVAQIIGSVIYVFSEIWLEKSNTHEMAKLLKERYGQIMIIPDATGSALKSSSAGQSDHAILKAFGHKIPNGIKNPFRVDRYNAVNMALEKKLLIIDTRCKRLIHDLEALSYKENTSLPDTRDPMLGHISDALGYLVHWAKPVVDRKLNMRVYV